MKRKNLAIVLFGVRIIAFFVVLILAIISLIMALWNLDALGWNQGRSLSRLIYAVTLVSAFAYAIVKRPSNRGRQFVVFWVILLVHIVVAVREMLVLTYVELLAPAFFMLVAVYAGWIADDLKNKTGVEKAETKGSSHYN